MKAPRHIGNVTLVLKSDGPSKRLLLVLKPPKSKADDKRKRKRVGAGLWVPPGGGTEPTDKSQKHSAQRELLEETGLRYPIKNFRKVGVLKGFNGSENDLLWLVHLYLLVKPSSDAQQPIPGDNVIKAKWFPTSSLPFKRMLTGDRDWIPRIVNGEMLSIMIVFNENGSDVRSKSVKPVRSFN
ncbi:MAG: NUDIX domain-containing protein [Patescibacteria group bacterium]|nr:NUDIX domain-containing protein [Patescibacteria group bacterium]